MSNDSYFYSIFYETSSTVFRIPYSLFTQLTQELRSLVVTTEMKVLIALKVLGHGVTTASVEAEFQVGETLARKCVNNFIMHVLELYEQKELKDLLTDEEKFKDVLKVNERRHGLPGYAGALDCVHVYWHMCPISYRKAYKGR